MPATVQRELQVCGTAEFLSDSAGIPDRLELVRGVIGPFSDAGKLYLLTNWGADDIIRLTGTEIWRKALEARGIQIPA